MKTQLVVTTALLSVMFTSPSFAQKQNDAARDEVAKLRADADAGNPEAMYWMGIKYQNGSDVPQDDRRAADWYRKAGDRGHGTSMFFLGVLYWNGRAGKTDLVEAYKWLSLASKHGSEQERRRASETRTSLARAMSPKMIAEADTRAAKWETAFTKRRK